MGKERCRGIPDTGDEKPRNRDGKAPRHRCACRHAGRGHIDLAQIRLSEGLQHRHRQHRRKNRGPEQRTEPEGRIHGA
ncbi:hypothetical protein SDC9_136716 [bioreactor metagenome]|uniref:Uncharacterized protein n=1 Tax=bioreactor metagenome TaxID=1076179 RepID=A0A645DJH1_9ZZZZ